MNLIEQILAIPDRVFTKDISIVGGTGTKDIYVEIPAGYGWCESIELYQLDKGDLSYYLVGLYEGRNANAIIEPVNADKFLVSSSQSKNSIRTRLPHRIVDRVTTVRVQPYQADGTASVPAGQTLKFQIVFNLFKEDMLKKHELKQHCN